MYIEIPIFWSDNDDEDEFTYLNTPHNEEAVVAINVDNISLHYECEDGGTVMKLNNGETYRSRVLYKEFKEMLNDIIIKIIIAANKN